MTEQLSLDEIMQAGKQVAETITSEWQQHVKGASFATDDLPADIKSSRGIEATASNASKQLGVYNDWDNLKAVIVGIPDNDVLPKWYPNWKNLDGNEISESADNAGQTKREADPARFARMVEQMDNLCEILESEGVTVFRPPLTPIEVGKVDPVGLCASWVRENFTIIGQRVIRNQTRVPFRRKELAALEGFFNKICRTLNPEAIGHGKKPFTLPPASNERNPDWENDPRAFLEGGDIFRFGKDVLVTMSFLTTSPAGFRWLADLLSSDGIDVWPAYLNHDWFHGDYAFGAIKEGLCMAYPDAFRDGLLPSPITDWDVIEMTRDEAYHMEGGNFICLRPGVIISPNPTRRLLRLLEQKNVDVIDIDFSDVTYWQGGVDCSTTELWREP